MATNLDYQKARRIRNASFADILSDQLAGDSTIRGAIKKTISLKTQARVKGFKEKFDPLNIAKFLTGGSSLGPALLGKLTGRSQKDIQYFSGRMQPIREKGTASRIGKEPGTGMSEGVNEMLRKIYYLMQVTREMDLERSEKEANFAEEKKLEDEKRHKQLLNALSKLNRGGGTASEEIDSRDFFGSLMDFLRRIPNVKIPPGLPRTAAQAASALAKGISGLVVGVVTSPAFVPVLIAAGLAFMVSSEKEAIEADPFNPKYDNNPYALSLRNGTTAGQEAKKNTARALTQQDTARRGEIEMALEYKTSDDVLMSRYGADTETLKKWLSDPKNQVWTRPADVPRTPLPPEVRGAPVVAPEDVPPAAVDPLGFTIGAVSPEEQPAREVTPVSATRRQPMFMLNKSMEPPAAPEAVPGTGLSSRLNDAVSQNLDANLPMNAGVVTPTVVRNVNNTQQKPPPQKIAELKTIAVRNLEPTFMKMIMDSTRVV